MPRTTSLQICRDFTSRRCKRGLNCPYKHDSTLRKTSTDKRMTKSRSRFQNAYADGSCIATMRPKLASKLCNAFLERRCKRDRCKFVHDAYVALDYIDRAKELIQAALDILKLSGTLKIAEDSVPHCYYYNTGADCVRNGGSSRCTYTHTLAVRRAVIKVLDGKTLSQTIIAEKCEGDDVVSPAGPSFPGVEQVTQGISGIAIISQEASSPTKIGSVQSSSNKTSDSPDSGKSYDSEQARTLIEVEGGWERSHWYKWGLKNINTDRCARNFGKLLPYLDQGMNPRALMAKMCKVGTEDCEFKYFRILPAEIRIKIWQLRLNGDRREVRIKFTYNWESGRLTDVGIRCLSPQPPLLQVNSESRAIALKRFNLLFGTAWHEPTTYFNWRKDRLFIQTARPNELHDIRPFIDGWDASRIRHLIIPMRDFIKGDELKVSDALAYFLNIKTLTCYYGTGKQDKQFLDICQWKKHVRGIKACLISSWFTCLRDVKDAQPPQIEFQPIHEIAAHYYGIDMLAY